MIKTIACIFLYLLPLGGNAQSYAEKIRVHREQYKQGFLKDDRAPLKAADTGYLRFYDADESYTITAAFTETPGTKPFNIPTHNGKLKKYRQYGLLTFRVHDTTVTLEVYQSPDLIKKPELRDYLFVPFTDLTNYETTYAGGRYLDLRTGEIRDGRIILDFNKCYNPYCAYADGYSCPIPPDANKLPVAIPAGEMMFGREIKE